MRLENWSLDLADGLFARLPQPRPSTHRLRHARIIAHRGVHDNRTTMENTLAAFARAADAGLWGVELDVRWTRDGEPVVCHDPDLMRVFGLGAAVHALSFVELRRRCPAVPHLDEVVARCGGRLHLMIELKPPPTSAGPRLPPPLSRHLGPLEAVRDYHLISLNPTLLAAYDHMAEACLPIARLAVASFSRLVVKKGYAGLCGHYALVGARHLARHGRRGQRIGTGFVDSRACLYRELNRGVSWLFSNRAAEMQRICRSA